MSTSSTEGHTPQSQEWTDQSHINPKTPLPVHNPNSSPEITRQESTQSQKTANVDYFASTKPNPAVSREGKHTAPHSFYPLYSPSEKAISSFGSSPTLRVRRGMSSAEHDFPVLSPAPEAPGDPPTSHELRRLRSQSSTKSIQQIHREGTLSTLRSHLGLIPEAPIVEGHEIHHHLTWSGIRVIMREPFAEFLGTFIMILFGDGSVAQVLLSGGLTNWGTGNYQSISWWYVSSIP